MMELSLRQIAELCGAKAPAGAESLMVTGICTDSRHIRPGELFVPLAGARDGHTFIASAEKAGACASLASMDVEAELPLLRVDDCLRALGAIASGYRDMMSVKLIGITGSVGKTTTREMTAAIMRKSFTVNSTKENFNNEIGLPLSILDTEPTDDIAVMEMGMNHFGELSRLTAIARPDVAVITNIGTMHIEFLGSREGILKAKLEILEGLADGGTAVLNGDEPMLWALRDSLRAQGKHKIVYFGRENPLCEVFAESVAESGECVEFTLKDCGRRVRIPVCGLHNVSDALAAIAAARALGAPDEDAVSALAEFRSVRMKVYEKNGVKILEDCYNAGPESMAASLEILRGCAGRRIAVLGDMLELGASSEQEHFLLGGRAAKCADAVYALGRYSDAVREGAAQGGVKTAVATQDRGQLLEQLSKTVRPGDALLFKGSHGMKMWELPEGLFAQA